MEIYVSVLKSWICFVYFLLPSNYCFDYDFEYVKDEVFGSGNLIKDRLVMKAIVIKDEYLRSRAYICLSLSSPFPSSCDISSISYIIEILVLLSWIPASKEFL